MRTLALTLAFWLANLALAAWFGGLIVSGQIVMAANPGASTGVSDLNVQALASVELLDLLRSIYIGSAIVLVASTVFSFLLERDYRRGIRWWTVFVIRTLAIGALMGTSLYSAGRTDASRDRVEDQLEHAQHEALRPDRRLGLGSAALGVDAADTDMVQADTSSAASDEGLDMARDVIADAYGEFSSIYVSRAWIEGLIVAIILFTGAWREATWMHRPYKRPGVVPDPAVATVPETAAPPPGETGAAPQEPASES